MNQLKILIIPLLFLLIGGILLPSKIIAEDDFDITSGNPDDYVSQPDVNQQYSQSQNQAVDIGTESASTPTSASTDSTSGSTGSSGNSFGSISVPSLPDYGPGSWAQIGTNILNLLARIAGIALIIMLLVGGVMYITSAGNEEQAKKAQTVIINAIIGIVIVALAWGIITFIAEKVQ